MKKFAQARLTRNVSISIQTTLKYLKWNVLKRFYNAFFRCSTTLKSCNRLVNQERSLQAHLLEVTWHYKATATRWWHRYLISGKNTFYLTEESVIFSKSTLHVFHMFILLFKNFCNEIKFIRSIPLFKFINTDVLYCWHNRFLFLTKSVELVWQ